MKIQSKFYNFIAHFQCELSKTTYFFPTRNPLKHTEFKYLPIPTVYILNVSRYPGNKRWEPLLYVPTMLQHEVGLVMSIREPIVRLFAYNYLLVDSFDIFSFENFHWLNY